MILIVHYFSIDFVYLVIIFTIWIFTSICINISCSSSSCLWSLFCFTSYTWLTWLKSFFLSSFSVLTSFTWCTRCDWSLLPIHCAFRSTLWSVFLITIIPIYCIRNLSRPLNLCFLPLKKSFDFFLSLSFLFFFLLSLYLNFLYPSCSRRECF